MLSTMRSPCVAVIRHSQRSPSAGGLELGYEGDEKVAEFS